MITVTGVHHAGFVVDDLDEAVDFLGNFGFVLGVTMDLEGGSMDSGNGINGGRASVAFLDGPGGTVELLRWDSGEAGKPSRLDEVGAAHLCLRVEDIFAAHAELTATGLDVVSVPQVEDVGVSWMFVHGPCGLRVELMESSSGAIV